MQPIQTSSYNAATAPGAVGNSPSDVLCSGDLGEEMAALDVENGEVERHIADQERES